MPDMFRSILVLTAEDIVVNGSLMEQEQALASLSAMCYTDDDSAEVIAELENKLRAAILRSKRPSRRNL